nr:MAG TPA: YopX protein [Caudoviricetes sp.]
MREILFKAKSVEYGKWLEGYYLKKYDFLGKEVHFIFLEYRPNAWRCIEVNPDTICQFTGLCDKNGNKIWENDIIKYHFGENYAPIKYGCYQNCFDSQKTEHVGFYVDWSDGKCLRKDLGYWINMVDTMPVGNIFDNPELLQEEHK